MMRVRPVASLESETLPAKVSAPPPAIPLTTRRLAPLLVSSPVKRMLFVPPNVAGSPPSVIGVETESPPVSGRSARRTPPLKMNSGVAPNCETPAFLLSTSVPCVRVVVPV